MSNDKAIKKEVANRHIMRAKEKLNAAEYLFNNGFYEDAVSRAFYSAFHAAKSLLALLGEFSNEDVDIVVLFWIKAVEAKYIDEAYGRILNKLSLLKESADHKAIAFLAKEEAKEAIDNAKSFLRVIEKKINELSPT
ncbi:MAG: hypothetical protein DRO67_05165 [Candidatus Asgardarchaeum californiense]|nr:MAG: hypothetical protein DRO67_05165 [Candidatus Asgardarchaeum californiense]